MLTQHLTTGFCSRNVPIFITIGIFTPTGQLNPMDHTMANWVKTQITPISTGMIPILLSLRSFFSIPPWRGAFTFTRWQPTMLSTRDVGIRGWAFIFLRKTQGSHPKLTMKFKGFIRTFKDLFNQIQGSIEEVKNLSNFPKFYYLT